MPNHHETVVREVALKECFADPLLDMMNFLNEIVMKFPKAISFAPGRPMEDYFQVEDSLKTIEQFVAMAAAKTGSTEKSVWQALGQYNRTNGIIHELIAQQLGLDEHIHVSPDAIMVTVGAQEAMAVVLAGFFDASRDVLLVSNPTYVGITGLAKILGLRVVPVQSGDRGLEPEAVEQAIRGCSRWGRPRAVYDIPDFNNPLGTYMPLENRSKLLDVCGRNDVLLIEDNPYGMFVYEGERLPALKALDREQVVLYIGSFAKTLFPGLRLGYLVADQKVKTNQFLAQELSKVKSVLTVNSSPLLQAIVGSVLLQHECSLKSLLAPKIDSYRRNRDVMIECLAAEFADLRELVRWNRPVGGFFLVLNLPFPFGPEELQRCASEYGVIVCPLRSFSVGPGGECQVRLSFSYGNESIIRAGVHRLASFVRDQLRTLRHPKPVDQLPSLS